MGIYRRLVPHYPKDFIHLIKYVLSGKVNQGRVSNPRIAGWTLSLINREISVDKSKRITRAPYALLCQGEEHECPLPMKENPKEESPFQMRKDCEVKEDEDMEIRATDGSCYHVDGKPVAGYAALRHQDGKILQGTVRPPSAQAAEVIAVLAVLTEADQDRVIQL